MCLHLDCGESFWSPHLKKDVVEKKKGQLHDENDGKAAIQEEKKCQGFIS